jgi:hypothetical protein
VTRGNSGCVPLPTPGGIKPMRLPLTSTGNGLRSKTSPPQLHHAPRLSRPVLGHGKGGGFPAGFRVAELAALALPSIAGSTGACSRGQGRGDRSLVHRKRAKARPSGQPPSHSLGLRLETAARSPHGPLAPTAASGTRHAIRRCDHAHGLMPSALMAQRLRQASAQGGNWYSVSATPRHSRSTQLRFCA